MEMKIPMTYHVTDGIEDDKMTNLKDKDTNGNTCKEKTQCIYVTTICWKKVTSFCLKSQITICDSQPWKGIKTPRRSLLISILEELSREYTSTNEQN